MKVIKLKPNDWKIYMAFCLRALEEEPTAFGRSAAEEALKKEFDIRKDLRDSLFYFAFRGKRVLGMAGVRFSGGEKVRHTATLVRVFVDPEFRSKGIGKKLVEKALKDLENDDKIIKVRLNVNSTQKSAIKLYKGLGFKKTGLHRKEIRVGNRYLDQYSMELIFDKKQ